MLKCCILADLKQKRALSCTQNVTVSVQINGLLEVCCATLLTLGVHTRIIAGFLALHLFGIAASVGGATGVRDAALGAAGIALALQVPDALTIDAENTSGKQSQTTA